MDKKGPTGLAVLGPLGIQNSIGSSGSALLWAGTFSTSVLMRPQLVAVWVIQLGGVRGHAGWMGQAFLLPCLGIHTFCIYLG